MVIFKFQSISTMLDHKILGLLELVVESYIEKWEPIWSKFLNTLNYQSWAPSTLRKYLKVLEDEEFVYQPYHSAGRIPTLKWWEFYVQRILEDVETPQNDILRARSQIKDLVEMLGSLVKWVVVWFIDGDDYHYLWIQNLLSHPTFLDELETVQQIVGRIESKKIIDMLKKKDIKRQQVNYSFVSIKEGKLVSIFTIKIPFGWREGIVAVISPVRTNYRHNLGILKKLLEVYNLA